jgi:hypothetical protein
LDLEENRTKREEKEREEGEKRKAVHVRGSREEKEDLSFNKEKPLFGRPRNRLSDAERAEHEEAEFAGS